MLKFYNIEHFSALHLSMQTLNGLCSSLLNLTRDPKSYISYFAQSKASLKKFKENSTVPRYPHSTTFQLHNCRQQEQFGAQCGTLFSSKPAYVRPSLSLCRLPATVATAGECLRSANCLASDAQTLSRNLLSCPCLWNEKICTIIDGCAFKICDLTRSTGHTKCVIYTLYSG